MPTIYGPDGRPAALPKRELATRRDAPQPMGLRQAGQWASAVSTLTPDRLRTMLRTVASGAWCPEFLELAEEIEERDGHYRGILPQRVLASAGAPLDVAPASPAAADVAAADEVRRDVLHAPGMHRLILDLLDGVAKGFAAAEVAWQYSRGRWRPKSYHRIDPRWVMLAPDGETPLLADADARWDGGGAAWSLPGRPFIPGKEIFHHHRTKAGIATRGGLAYVMATLWLLKSASVRGWAALAEVFGMPLRIGRYGPDATPQDIQTLIDALTALALDAGCAIPESMNIEIIQQATGGKDGGGGGAIFSGLARWCDEQASKAVLGQTMTADAGSSRAQAEVHADVREDLIADDARQIGDTLSATVVAWYCDLNGVAPAPRVTLPPPPDEVDVAALVQLARAGLRIPAAWVRERKGIPEPAPGDEIMTGLPARPRAPRGGGSADGDDDPPEEEGDQAFEAAAAGEAAGAAVRMVRRRLAAAESPEAFLAGDARALTALGDDLALRLFEMRAGADAGDDGDAELQAVGAPGPIPRAALRVLRSKRRAPSTRWTDIWREEHAMAFTAAWLTSDELVSEVHGDLVKALRRGETMEAFRARLTPRLREMGWAPPLRGGDVPSRLRRIYNTNMRTARAAGRWQAAVAADRRQPGQWFLLYELGPSLKHRDDHAAWAGTILPVDSPWWRTHFPPNGWGCKCRVRLITAAEAARRGGPSRRPPPTRTERVPMTVVDPATGRATARMVSRTEGIDLGWNYNVGQFRPAGPNGAVADHLERMLSGVSPGGPNAWGSLPAAARTAMARDRAARHVGGGAFRAFLDPAGGALRLDTFPPRWEADTPLAVLPAGYVGGGGALPELLRLTLSGAVKQRRSHGPRRQAGKGAVTPVDYRRLQRMIDGGAAVEGPPGRWRIDDADGWTAVIARDGLGRPVLVTFYRRNPPGATDP